MNSKVIFGSILIVLGSLFLIDRIGILGDLSFNVWDIIWTFWPIFLLIPGIKLILENKITGGIILVTLSVVLLLTKIFDWNFFAVLWPLAIIAIGVSVIVKPEESKFNSTDKNFNNEKINDTVAFWGTEKDVISKNFKGGEINAVFGGYKLDLRQAEISKEGAKLTVNAIFGGVELITPKNCRVITNGTGIFGGWSPNVKPNDIKEPTLEIVGSAVFGGVDIKEGN